MKGKYFREKEIRAITGGNKTLFREVIKPQPELVQDFNGQKKLWFPDTNPIWMPTSRQQSEGIWNPMLRKFCRYQVGEVVYIKEAHFIGGIKPDEWVIFKDSKLPIRNTKIQDYVWRSPLFMPAWAARRFVKITAVGAEILRLPLSASELILEGGVDAILLLTLIDGEWVFRYEFSLANKGGNE